jgi:hypothetical protein
MFSRGLCSWGDLLTPGDGIRMRLALGAFIACYPGGTDQRQQHVEIPELSRDLRND